MKVVKPIETTDDNFQSSTIQEPDITTGEQEFVAIPFDGYDISSLVDNPTDISKDFGSSDYFVLNRSTKEILRFNEFFSFEKKITASFSTDTLQCMGTSNFSSDPITPLFYGSGARVQLYNENLSGYITSPDFKSYLDGSGINLNAKGLFGRQDGGDSSLYILNESGGSYYVVKVNIFSSTTMGVRYNRAISTSRGTPRDIQYRDGKYSLLFSDASGTSISFYDESFSTEISNHTITGSNPDQPYDAFTIGESGGFKFLCESTEKIYNVDNNYNHGATYKAGDEVIKASIHKKYRCVIDTTQDPVDGVDEVPPTWVELGATNRWAMFDGISTYQASFASGVDVSVRPIGIISAITAFNIENVNQVKITIADLDTGTSYDETFNTTGLEDLIAVDLPPFENPLVTVEFSGVDIKIGELVMGTGKELGVLLTGVISDRIDYSRNTYDEFGKLTYIPRPIVKYTTYPIAIPKKEGPGIERYLDGLKGEQAVWVGDIGDGDYITTRGVIERSPMVYDNRSIVKYQIKVRGSI